MAVNYNDGKWHGWNGGECPVHPETVVEVRWKSDYATQQCQAGSIDSSSQWTWEEEGSNRVVAFRVVMEHREPREWWIDPERCIVTEFYHAGFVHVREVIE